MSDEWRLYINNLVKWIDGQHAEIRRLTRELEEERSLISTTMVERLRAENERLRAENKELKAKVAYLIRLTDDEPPTH